MKYKININKNERLAATVIALLIFVIMLIVGFAEITMLSSNKNIVANISDLKEYQVGVIFGGGMDSIGIQTEDQKERVSLGIELYKKNKVKTLLMTGDDGELRNNEVDFMRAQAVYSGVPLYSVEVDGKGYRTFESCKNLKEKYGYSEILVVSQRYHLKRIIYICEQMGINTTGIAADDYLEKKAVSHFREPLARVKALIEVWLYKNTQY